MGRAVRLYTSSCLLSGLNTVSNVKVFGGSLGVSCLFTVMVPRISSTLTDCLYPITFSFWFRGRHRTTTLTLSLTSDFSGLSSLLLCKKNPKEHLSYNFHSRVTIKGSLCRTADIYSHNTLTGDSKLKYSFFFLNVCHSLLTKTQ